MRTYTTYILRCADKSYYVGVTNNIEMRFSQHQEGIDITCYTYSRRPAELVCVESFDDINDAIRREKQLKKWSRKKKEALIDQNYWMLQEFSRKQSESSFDTQAIPKLGVDVIIEGDNGTILFIQRKDDGCWSLPGGWMEKGETPDRAAIRETKEETGLQIKLIELADIHIRSTGSVHLTYIGRRFSGAILPSSEEANRIVFLSVNDVKKWHADHEERVRRVIRKVVNKK